MLKITENNITKGMNVSIRNSWRKQIIALTGKEDFPNTFVVGEETWGIGAKSFYECTSLNDDGHKKPVTIYVDALTLQYVSSVEVPDSNVGLYFTDYLPIENTQLIITDKKNPLKILPCEFTLKYELRDKKPVLYFALESLLDFSEINLAAQAKNPWKMLKGSDTYMTDMERMYQDTFIHKSWVTYVCNAYADYLEAEGYKEDADDLRARARVHDNSKVQNSEERRSLTKIVNDRSSLRDPKALLTQWQRDSIELHHENNEHHPEHWPDQNLMPLRARREFICDCCARSLQYGTDLVPFMEERLKNTFKFNEIIQEEILHECKIVWSLVKR